MSKLSIREKERGDKLYHGEVNKIVAAINEIDEAQTSDNTAIATNTANISTNATAIAALQKSVKELDEFDMTLDAATLANKTSIAALDTRVTAVENKTAEATKVTITRMSGSTYCHSVGYWPTGGRVDDVAFSVRSVTTDGKGNTTLNTIKEIQVINDNGLSVLETIAVERNSSSTSSADDFMVEVTKYYKQGVDSFLLIAVDEYGNFSNAFDIQVYESVESVTISGDDTISDINTDHAYTAVTNGGTYSKLEWSVNNFTQYGSYSTSGNNATLTAYTQPVGSDGYVTISCAITNMDGSKVDASKTITIAKEVPTIVAKGSMWKAFSYPAPISLNVSGLEAYVVTEYTDDTTGIGLTKITGAIAANVPVLLHTTEGGTYELPVVASGSVPETNMLMSTNELTDGLSGASLFAMVDYYNETPTFSYYSYGDTSGLDSNSAILPMYMGYSSGATLPCYIVQSAVEVTWITIDDTITDPATKISGDVGTGQIAAIRAASHRVLGKLTASGVMTYYPLDDSNSALYADGTTAADLTGGDGDVFVKLPTFFYCHKSEATDVHQIGFYMGDTAPSDGNVWNKYDGNHLIGVYEAYVVSNKVYSRSGYISSANVSQANFKTYAANRDSKMTIVNWQMHCVMALLFYGYYGNTNSQAICGSGTNTYQKANGLTNSLGMTDTDSTNGNTMSINYWGLENWWGNKWEWIGNVVSQSGKWTITEADGTGRTISNQSINTGGYLSKVFYGDYCDMIATSITGASSTSCYADYYYDSTDSNARVVQRSNSHSYTNGGVACAYANNDSSYTIANYGSRLAFIGECVEAASVAVFKALTAIA